MLKDLAIELVVLVSLFWCIFLFVPGLMEPSSFNYRLGVLPLFVFIGLLFYSGFHLKRLLDKGKTKQAIIFLVVLLATLIISSAVVWDLFQPRMM